jgi:Zn-dependent metalloprotease
MRARRGEPLGHARGALSRTNQNRTVRTYYRTPEGVMKTTANPAARAHAKQLMSGGMLFAMLLLSSIALPATEAARQRAEAAVTGISSSLQGAAGVDLAVRSYLTNEQGRTVVHAYQRYQGHRVWGSSGTIRTDAQGVARLQASNFTSTPTPAGSPVLTAQQAINIALKAMALKGRPAPPQAELVVFPTKYHGGLQLAWDPVKLDYTFDRGRSVMTTPPSDPFVWAYEVHLFARNGIDGLQDRLYVVDARTGAIVRVTNGLQSLAPVNPPTQRPTDVAAKGIGHSQYSGIVPLDTTQHQDGTFALIDRTRASKYNPYLHDGYYDIYGNQILDADGQAISAIGLQTLTETHEGTWNDFTWISDNWWFDENPTDSWGDSQQFVMYPYGGETSVNGQTAAVDAHYGMATTWDFYKYVFSRDGIDNQGTSAISTVHTVNQFAYYYDNAFWSDYAFGMFYSDGTFFPGVDPNTGLPTPPNSNGLTTLTALDIIGHEMTHGVTSNSAQLAYDGESGGLNEGTSDIMGKMVEVWSKRPAGTDTVIPVSGANWVVGHDVRSGGLRSMIKPSGDGLSADSWYAGIQYMDVHYVSGPLNRFFYFLCEGASSTVGDPAYSPYLPAGMTGIGNDHAARIWYKTLTEYLAFDSTYATARPAAISAATDLYGASSAEVAAVKSAFAAINVGSATDQPRVSIDMLLLHPAGTPLDASGDSPFARMPIVAMTTTVKLRADVKNTTNTAVVWKLGNSPGAFNSLWFRHVGGTVTDDGQWTPDNSWGFHGMTVVSKADPLEYAEGGAWVVDGDADADTQFDALDLGAVALSWGLDGWVNASHSIVQDGWVDSMDVTAIVEAFKNAFGGK